LWARPEPTQLEHLSDVSFLGKLLLLPANVRLDWKVTHTLAYLASSSATKEKSFITLTSGEKVLKLFFFIAEGGQNKLGCFPL
jgi:hypothetical protein